MAKAIVYVNVPLEAAEHAAIQEMARREGRAKGQQIRLLALKQLRLSPLPAISEARQTVIK